MEILLNGERRTVPDGLTVAGLLAELAIDFRRVAVEHNLVVLKRAAYAATPLADRDEVEIVAFVGGGSTTP